MGSASDKIGGPAADPYGSALRRAHLAIGILVALMLITGFVFDFRRDLGLSERKLLIMTMHVFLGYGLIVALASRLVVSARSKTARIRNSIIRAGDIAKLFKGGKLRFAGRSPLSRVLATTIYLALIANISTGYVFATTELFHPPFGGYVSKYIAGEAREDPVAAIRNGEFDQERMSAVRRFRKPFAKAHIYGAYLIALLTIVHTAGMLLSEWRAPAPSTARGRAPLMLFGPRRPR